MKRIAILFALCFLLGLPRLGFAMELVKKDNMSFAVNGRIQTLGFAQRVDDSVRSNERLYLFLKQARLEFLGDYDHYKFDAQLAFASEDTVLAPNPGISLNLLDFSFDIPLFGSTFLKVGQFLVPFGRERLAADASLSFADRSINNLAFQVGRDVGVALHSTPGPLALAFGVFTGGGRDVPQRFLPQDLGFPMIVARVGIQSGTKDDVFSVKQSETRVDRRYWGVFANGLYLQDSLIGHSTVLNVKTAEKPLLINNNWNPYISRTPFQKGHLFQTSVDALYRKPVGSFLVSAEVEGNYGRYSNSYGALDLVGGRTQFSGYHKPVEFSLRYDFIRPDKHFLNGGASITGGTGLIHEVTPAVTYYINEQHAKLIADFPLLINVPVVTEPGVGAYVLTEQADQAAVLNPARTGGPGTVARKFVPEARLLLQLSF